jgi:hypothetical protein
MKDLNGKISKEILIENPRIDIIETRTKTGAATRIEGKPLDEKLMETKVYGNRTPAPRVIIDESGKRVSDSETRGTGAVGRAKFPQTTKDDGNNQNTDTTITPETRNRGNGFPTRSTGGKSDESTNDTPVKSPRNDRNENQSPPIYAPQDRKQEPPVRQPPPERKVDPPREREETRPQPRIEPREMPRVEPRQQPTKIEPPKKEEQKPSPPPRQKDEKPNNKDN